MASTQPLMTILPSNPDTKFSARYAAFLHNCVRFNKLSLIEEIDPLLHRYLVSFPAMQVCRLRAKIGLILLAIGIMPFGYSKLICKSDQCKLLLDSRWGAMVGFALIFVIMVLSWGVQTVVARCLMTRQGAGCDRLVISGRRYRLTFRFYYWVYKLWQSHLILPHAKGLVYGNVNLLPAHAGVLNHAGMFVVGIAVNVIHAIVIVFIVLAVWTHHYGYVTIVGYSIARAALFSMGFLLSPPGHIVALIDQCIATHPASSIFARMEQSGSFAITDEELVDLVGQLSTQGRPKSFFKAIPSSTHCIDIAYKKGDAWGVLDLADGTWNSTQ